ncbi:ankyrin repeat domain-containing protein [Baaleninema simplex]|uniref:ankyrin repeat domain-containing protein n=1 Tax=Baaleninema simplex TaxID=2862350 RepID=UPI000369A99C|nr:ankyrin repeat domain-containing protein [Baaleninema simplex]
MDYSQPINPHLSANFSQLNSAIQENDIKFIKYAIDRKLTFSPKEEGVCTKIPFVLACELGRLEIVEMLIKYRNEIDLDIDQFLEEEFWDEALTGLMAASGKGHIQVVKTLVLAGANPNIQTCYGETALSFAARGGYIDIFEELAPLVNCIDPEHIDILRKIADSESRLNSRHKN